MLLLNTALSVEQQKPQSHANIGWSVFTDKVISSLNNHPHPLVFLLWGAHAKNKASLITDKRHLILTAAHPSPYSVQGFSGCRHFSRANAFLANHNRRGIDWQLND